GEGRRRHERSSRERRGHHTNGAADKAADGPISPFALRPSAHGPRPTALADGPRRALPLGPGARQRGAGARAVPLRAAAAGGARGVAPAGATVARGVSLVLRPAGAPAAARRLPHRPLRARLLRGDLPPRLALCLARPRQDRPAAAGADGGGGRARAG